MGSNHAAKYGLIAGFVAILYFGGIYLYSEISLEKQLMVHPYVTFSKHLIYLVFMFFSIKTVITQKPSKELSVLIKPAFVTFLIANLVFYFYYFVMFKYVDTSLMEASMEYMLDFVPQYKEEGIPGKVNPITESNNEIKLSSTVFAYVREIILGFVFSGILALIFRKR